MRKPRARSVKALLRGEQDRAESIRSVCRFDTSRLFWAGYAEGIGFALRNQSAPPAAPPPPPSGGSPMPGEVLTPEERAAAVWAQLYLQDSVVAEDEETGPAQIAAAIRSAEEAALERARRAVCNYPGTDDEFPCPNCQRIRALLKETPAGEEKSHHE